MEKLLNCPFCGSTQITLSDISDKEVFHSCVDCRGQGPDGNSRDKSTELWNTRATDPLMEEMKAELKRLHIKQDEDRFAALADDSVPRLVFHAAIEAIANKDSLLEEMVEALEDAVHQMKQVCGNCEQWIDWVEAEQALQKYREMRDADRMHVDE